MNVRQLIEALSAIEDKEKLVYVKSGTDDGSCCSPGDYEWDESSYISEEMISDWVWNEKKTKRVLSALNVVKIDNY